MASPMRIVAVLDAAGHPELVEHLKGVPKRARAARLKTLATVGLVLRGRLPVDPVPPTAPTDLCRTDDRPEHPPSLPARSSLNATLRDSLKF